ncbi:MAG: hypothetical protein JWQ35_2303 [Bacteriovoracaceae bacterium]|nr:hypothetical protein [Bacteriovoracaceae bacterium]
MDGQHQEQKIHCLLNNHFSFSSFRKGQLDIIKSVLSGKDTLAVMPTGQGKSLCYQLPALSLGGIVIVISPLIALMEDQVRSLEARGIPAACLHSGQSLSLKKNIFDRLKSSDNFLLYLSPERVQKEGFAAWIKTQKISLFAIDEAHCISQWGSDFREDYHRLSLFRELRPEVPILALTATATPQVLNDITRQLQLKNPDRHIYGFYRPNLYYQVELCENDFQKSDYLRQALRENPEGRVLIYCGTRKQSEDLSEFLREEFPSIGFYHAGMSAELRTQVQKSYEASEIRILCATNAFGMGVDHPDVRLVVHYQMPANIESFYQEAGRAGRDAKHSTCLLLYSKKDKGLQSFFIRESKSPELIKKSRWRALDAITQFAEGGECRHSGILTYFRDAQRIRECGHCDICAPTSDRKISRPLQTFEPPMVKIKKLKKRPVEEDLPLTKEEELRYEVLKIWRKKYADDNDIPAFLVFSNKSLRDLARRNPLNLTELKACYGFGEQKTETFGDLIVSELKSLEPREAIRI